MQRRLNCKLCVHCVSAARLCTSVVCVCVKANKNCVLYSNTYSCWHCLSWAQVAHGRRVTCGRVAIGLGQPRTSLSQVRIMTLDSRPRVCFAHELEHQLLLLEPTVASSNSTASDRMATLDRKGRFGRRNEFIRRRARAGVAGHLERSVLSAGRPADELSRGKGQNVGCTTQIWISDPQTFAAGLRLVEALLPHLAQRGQVS